LSRVQVDLICLDSIVPDSELEDLWRWLASDRSRPTPPVVLLAPPSAITTSSMLPSFFRRKRDGLVTKPIDGAVLAREIARVLDERTNEETGGVLRVGAISLDRARQQILFDDGATIDLTPTELRLVDTLMARAGEYVATDMLLRQVWHFPAETGGAEIVRAHVSNIRRKLRNGGIDPQLLHTIPYQGYAFVEMSR
jgi:DNA-binding response OmpR family regulator